MPSSSPISTSPTFNINPSNNIANITDRVVLKLLTENTNSHTETMNHIEETVPDEDEQEFEFPVMCRDSNLCYDLSDDDHISLRYPLFDRSLLSDVDLNLCNGVNTPMMESKQPVFHRSLLFNGDLNLRNGVNTPITESKHFDRNLFADGDVNLLNGVNSSITESKHCDRNLFSNGDLNLLNGVNTPKTESKHFDRNLFSDGDLNIRNGVNTPKTESIPLDRNLFSDVDLNLRNGVDITKTEAKQPVFDLNLSNGVNSNNSMTESKQPLEARLSLMKLFDEDHETTSFSSSFSSSDELDGITPGTYCIWKPKTDPDPDPNRKHRKSNSISIGNTSNRWKVRDLLKRSYSDDSYSSCKDSPVLVTISANQKGNKIGKSGKVGSTKTEKNIPACKSKIGNVRLPWYLPYRVDQLAAYSNYTGMNRNIYR